MQYICNKRFSSYDTFVFKKKEKLGDIPMRHLVYRVQPLPASMLPIIWDFGQLNDEVERLYINQIVRVRFSSYKTIVANQQELIVGMLASSQAFMRSQQNECSFVSLRDVQRVITIVQWFLERGEPIFEQIRRKKDRNYNRFTSNHHSDSDDDDDDEDDLDRGQLSINSKIGKKDPETKPTDPSTTNLIDSVILALNICYHVKLHEDQHRVQYRTMIAGYLNKFDAKQQVTEQTMLKEIDYCYQVYFANCYTGNWAYITNCKTKLKINKRYSCKKFNFRTPLPRTRRSRRTYS